MMFREEDAKARICPVMSDQSGGFVRCVGSNCMLWQVGAPEVEVFVVPLGLKEPPGHPPGEGWMLSIHNGSLAWIRKVAEVGGCSLANK